MNSTSVINKIELGLYSTLISVMSGINRLKSHAQHFSTISIDESADGPDFSKLDDDRVAGKMISLSWETIEQALLTLFLWTILGFAAGFLIGMLKPG